MNDSFRQAVGDFPRIPLTLRPESTAVLLIDVQNDFCAPEGIYARNGLECPGIPALMGPLAEFLAALFGRNTPAARTARPSRRGCTSRAGLF